MSESYCPVLLDDAAAQALIDGFPKPSRVVVAMFLGYLDRHLRRYIELSPFCCISTADAQGNQDVSPRGDPPGSFKVLDDRTIAIPDRPGNNRIDSLRNLLVNPRIGLIFMLPGVDETVRISGRARLSTDHKLLESMAVQGKNPRLAIVVEVVVAHIHCAKAFRRSKLWDPASYGSRDRLPSLGQIIGEQINMTAAQTARLDELNDRATLEGLWEPFIPTGPRADDGVG
jgi:PPOX class probable FMN-dependent enzyme